MSAVASPIDVPQYQEQCDAMTLPPPPPENFCLRPMRYNYEAKRPSPPAYPAEVLICFVPYQNKCCSNVFLHSRHFIMI